MSAPAVTTLWPRAEPAPTEHAWFLLPRSELGYLFLLGVPVVAGLLNVKNVKLAGVSLEVLPLALCPMGAFILLLAGKAMHKSRVIAFPTLGAWAAGCGLVWASLLWCDGGADRQAVQQAVQYCMPVLMGAMAAFFVTRESQLRLLHRLTVAMLPLLGLFTLAGWAGVLGFEPELDIATVDRRPMAMTAVLIGCVVISGGFSARALLGWGFCLLLAVVTESRMAIGVLLVAPVLHPLCTLRWRIAAFTAAMAIGIGLLQTPKFQQRFFQGEQPGVHQLMHGKIQGAGRFDAWPLIWHEAWKRPVLGAGVHSSSRYVPTIWTRMECPHNEYLRVFFEFGVVGLALSLLVLARQFTDLHRRIRSTHGLVQHTYTAVWLGFCMFLLMACTDNPLGYCLRYTNLLFVFLGAAYGVELHRVRRADPVNASPAPDTIEVN